MSLRGCNLKTIYRPPKEKFNKYVMYSLKCAKDKNCFIFSTFFIANITTHSFISMHIINVNISFKNYIK